MNRTKKTEWENKDRSSSLKKKKNLPLENLKLNKKNFKDTSKSEKNSPAALRPYKLRYISGVSCKTPRQTTNSPKTSSQKTSPRNNKLVKIVNKNFRKSFEVKPGFQIQNSYKKPCKPSSSENKKHRKGILEHSNSNYNLKVNDYNKEIIITDIKNHFEVFKTDPKTKISQYHIIKLIGQGAFGKVMLGIHILTEKEVAIKFIDKSLMQNEYSRKKIFREVFILKKMRSNYVVKILEVFEIEENFLIVMEYMPGGDLLNYLKSNGKMTEAQGKKIFYQIILGAITIHKADVLHRDFKLDNILLSKCLTKIKICDFGVSKFITKGEIVIDQCGTPAYLAPEIVLDKGYEGFWSDIWSLGVLLFCMICGRVPFKANNLGDLHKAILIGKYEIPDFISEEAKDLIKKMLQIIPHKRIQLESILDHPWLSDDTDDFEEINEYEILKLNQAVISKIETFGYPKQFIIESLVYKSLNYAYAAYELLTCEM